MRRGAGLCTVGSVLCQPNAAAAATCTAYSDGGTEAGRSTCASGTCNVDPIFSGAITNVWDWVNQLNAAYPTGSNELETILLAPTGGSPGNPPFDGCKGMSGRFSSCERIHDLHARSLEIIDVSSRQGETVM